MSVMTVLLTVVVSGDVVLADETLWTTEAFVVTCWWSRASDRDNVCGKDVIEVLPAICAGAAEAMRAIAVLGRVAVVAH